MTKTPTHAGGYESDGARYIHPSPERNKGPILEILKEILPASGLVLEVGAGSGQHTAHFAAHFSHLEWQATEPDADLRTSIAAWIDYAGIANARDPLDLDCRQSDWPVDQAAAVISSNMIHISPWASCLGLISGAGRILGEGGVLYFYGPFSEGGVHTSPGNADFDASLKSRDPELGIRDVDDVTALARSHGLEFERRVTMPSNNLSLIYRKS
jgi:SAM-dependent methyltransferase